MAGFWEGKELEVDSPKSLPICRGYKRESVFAFDKSRVTLLGELLGCCQEEDGIDANLTGKLENPGFQFLLFGEGQWPFAPESHGSLLQVR